MARILGLRVITWLCLAPPAQAAELRGTVLMADGGPAVGATVSAAAMFYKPRQPQRHAVKATNNLRTSFRGSFRHA